MNTKILLMALRTLSFACFFQVSAQVQEAGSRATTGLAMVIALDSTGRVYVGVYSTSNVNVIVKFSKQHHQQPKRCANLLRERSASIPGPLALDRFASL